MPPRSVPFRRFELSASPRLFRLEVALHGCAAVAALANPLAFQYRALLVLAVAASLVRYLRRHREPPEVAALQVGTDGGWLLLLRDGREQPVELSASSISSPLLVWLAWTEPRGRAGLLILPDSLPGDQYRELRVSLRIAAVRAGG